MKTWKNKHINIQCQEKCPAFCVHGATKTLLGPLLPEPPVESEQQWAPHWSVICCGQRSTIGRWLRNVYPLFRPSLLLTADRSGGQKSHSRRAVVLPLNRGGQGGKRARCNRPVASDLKEPSKKFWCDAEEFFRRGLLLGELLQVCLLLEPLPTKVWKVFKNMLTI